MGKCNVCGCAEFEENVFQKTKCKNCLHDHTVKPSNSFSFVATENAAAKHIPEKKALPPVPKGPSTPVPAYRGNSKSQISRGPVSPRKPLPAAPSRANSKSIDRKGKAASGFTFKKVFKGASAAVSSAAGTVKDAVTGKEEEEGARAPMEIMGPTGFSHDGHMGFSDSGIEAFNLPPDWQALLNNLNNTLKAMGVEGLNKEEAAMILTGKVGLTKDKATGTWASSNRPSKAVRAARGGRGGRGKRATLIGTRNAQPVVKKHDTAGPRIISEYAPELTSDIKQSQDVPTPTTQPESKVSHATTEAKDAPIGDAKLLAEENRFLRIELEQLKQLVLDVQNKNSSMEKTVKRLEEGKEQSQKALATKSQELVNLKGRFVSTNSELERLKQKQESLREELKAARSEASASAAESKAADAHAARVNELQEEAASLKDKLSQLKSSSAKELEEKQSALEAATQAKVDLDLELASLRTQLSAAQSLGDASKKAELYEEQLESMKKQMADQRQELVRQLEDEKESKVELRAELSAAREAAEVAGKAKDEISVKVKDLEKTVDALKGESTSAQAELAVELQKAQQQLAEEKTKASTADEEVKRLQGQVDELNSSLQAAKRKLESESKDKSSFEAEVAHVKELMEGRIAEVKQQLSSKEEVLASMKAKNKKLALELSEATSRALSMSKSEQDKSEQAKRFEEEISSLRGEMSASITELEAKLKEANAQKSTLEDSKHAADMQLAATQMELKEKCSLSEEQEAALKQAQEDKKSTVERITKDLTAAKDNAKSLQEALSAATKECATAEKSLNAALAKLKSVEADKEKAEESGNSLKVKLQELKQSTAEQVSSLERKIADVEGQLSSAREASHTLEMDLQAATRKLKAAQQSSEDVVKARERFESELASINASTQAQVQELREQIDREKHRVSEALADKDRAEKERKEIEVKMEELKRTHGEQSSGALAQLQEEKQELADDLDRSKKDLQDERTRRIELEEELKDLQREVEQLSATLASSDASKSDKDSALRALEMESASLAAEVEALKRQLHQAQIVKTSAPAAPVPTPPPPAPGPPPPAPAPPTGPPPSIAFKAGAKPAGAPGAPVGDLMSQIRNPGVALKHVDPDEKEKDEDISKHFDDQNVLHILARALIARRQDIQEEPQEDDDDAW